MGVTVIDGNHLSALLRISAGSTVHIRNVTLRRGVGSLSSYSLGSAITNEGTLTLTSSEVADNRKPQGGGGAIENSGILHVIDSLIHGNALAGDVLGGGGIVNWQPGDLHIVNSIISNNSISGEGTGGRCL